jgi:hypothetical protein
MSIKNKVFAVAASLALVGGAGTAGVMTAGTASAATPSCGDTCVNFFVQTFDTHHHPGFVLDVYKQRQAIGQPVILFRTSNADPAEDWTFSEQGTVADFFAAGLVSSALALHYGCIAGVNFPDCPGGAKATNFAAVEIEYAPFGAATGLCMGTATTAGINTKVSLQPCGVSSKTVWVVDTANAVADSRTVINPGAFTPLINGSDTNFSHPFVLTYPQDDYPTDMPRPQLITNNLQGYSTGTIIDRQEWADNLGVLR